MTAGADEPTSRRNRSRIVGLWRRVDPVSRLLLATHLAFNVGFYLVLPFLADHLGDDLGLASGTVGLVLGVRTFSQQGLFAVGGAVADRIGPKPLVVGGCMVRAVGFALLGIGESLGPVLAGAILTGLAGAMFSPAVDASLASRATELEKRGIVSRAEVFAAFAVFGNIGTVAGPVLGLALVAVGFRGSALVAAVIFIGIGGAHAVMLPNTPGAHATDRLRDGWREVIANRRFTLFAVGYAAYLVSYNQLYLALPHELRRSTGSTAMLSVLFVMSSAMVVAGQLRVTDRARRMPTTRAMTVGFSLISSAFAAVLVSLMLPTSRVSTQVATTAFVLALTLGQMTVGPVASNLVPTLAGDRRLGAYFGALSSAGGVFVLIVSPIVGALLDLRASPWPAWVLLTALPLGGLLLIRKALSPSARN